MIRKFLFARKLLVRFLIYKLDKSGLSKKDWQTLKQVREEIYEEELLRQYG